MSIFQALPLMAQVKVSAHDKNHSLENFTVLSQVKFSSKCKICNKTVTVDLEAELPVSGEVLFDICQKPDLIWYLRPDTQSTPLVPSGYPILKPRISVALGLIILLDVKVKFL